jgi:hypothetical protein
MGVVSIDDARTIAAARASEGSMVSTPARKSGTKTMSNHTVANIRAHRGA